MAHLSAIINFWDGGELLPYAVENWWKCGVDSVIIVYSNLSNYGEHIDNDKFIMSPEFGLCHRYHYEPPGSSPMNKETLKRNHGLSWARSIGATHFVTADCDEFYDPEQFKEEWSKFQRANWQGLCCASRVYFKRPTLTIGEDVTIVPFIHTLQTGLYHCMNRKYPYAFINNQIRIDPTRQLSISTNVAWSPIIMEHMSWVRTDIERKIRNSTARANIEKSDVREEFKVAEAGYFLKFYRRTLYTVENKFNLPDYGGQNLGRDVSHGGQPPTPTDKVAKR